MATNEWTADRRLYLDKDGNVVEADDPARATLLVNAGAALPLDQARALGLVDADGAAVKAKKASANKARASAPENKAAAEDDELNAATPESRKAARKG
jgi:hypothetical protein